MLRITRLLHRCSIKVFRVRTRRNTRAMNARVNSFVRRYSYKDRRVSLIEVTPNSESVRIYRTRYGVYGDGVSPIVTVRQAVGWEIKPIVNSCADCRWEMPSRLNSYSWEEHVKRVKASRREAQHDNISCLSDLQRSVISSNIFL